MWVGKKVRLRALEREDLPLTHKWVNTPEVVAYEGHPFPISMAEEERWFEARLQDNNRKVLIIETMDKNEPIGNIYFDIDWRHRSANISITIGELDAQNQGYGSEALLTAVQQAFEVMGLNRLSASILASNKRSIRAFEKAGFREEGMRRQSYFWQGVFQDQVLMSVLREEYDASRQ